MRLISKAIEFTSSYTYDSGANSIEKQMSRGNSSGLMGYKVNGESEKVRRESKEKDSMASTLSDVEKSELIRFRKVRQEKLIEKEGTKNKKLRDRLNKYRTPLPMRIKEDIKRKKGLSSGGVSVISPTI
jgi:hypothetical protein